MLLACCRKSPTFPPAEQTGAGVEKASPFLRGEGLELMVLGLKLCSLKSHNLLVQKALSETCFSSVPDHLIPSSQQDLTHHTLLCSLITMGLVYLGFAPWPDGSEQAALPRDIITCTGLQLQIMRKPCSFVMSEGVEEPGCILSPVPARFSCNVGGPSVMDSKGDAGIPATPLF